MTCDQIERDEIAEQYLAGRLSSADQIRFETHFFDCGHCQERLRLLEDVRSVSARDGAPVAARSAPYFAGVPGGRSLWRLAGAGLAAAAVIVLAVRIGQNPDRDSPAESSITSERRDDIV